MDIDKIIERLKEHFDFSTNKELANKLKIHPSMLSNWKKRGKLNMNVLMKIEDEIDLDWILKGKSAKASIKKYSQFTNSKEFNALESKGVTPPIILIPEKVQAGYSSLFGQFSDENLQIMIHNDYKDGKKYRFFEVSGNSMESYIFSGDYLLCERKQENEIKQTKIYVFYTKNGFICKRLGDLINTSEKYIILHSDNDKYQPAKLLKEDILEIWEVLEINRKVK
ncbi:MAG: hypothetical protein EAZ85_04745 [Bacteroidetes bacterium]|nr:MAG: hypothetical protein EAZ85_04745 [Bacteroidota bacterium]TAG90207.1 MAG: hypothetical protein EAZ20_04980 [Bacteroidota bacterium]